MSQHRFTRDLAYIIVIALLVALSGQLFWNTHHTPAFYATPKVYYNKETPFNQKIIQIIHNADERIYFSVYTFTRYDIKDALLGAKHRGVSIIGVTDKNQIEAIPNQEKIVQQLRDAGIPVYTQDHSYIMHTKVIVSEKEYASGSYNWTASATDKNDEVLEVGTDEHTRREYERILKVLVDKYKTK